MAQPESPHFPKSARGDRVTVIHQSRKKVFDVDPSVSVHALRLRAMYEFALFRGVGGDGERYVLKDGNTGEAVSDDGFLEQDVYLLVKA